MGLWSDTSNFLSGGARGDTEEGYDKSSGYYRPYQQGGMQDYNSYRDYVHGEGSNLAPYGNAGSWQYGQINQSPTDYYNQIMKGYNESPQAQYEQQQALKASNAAGSASGLAASGAAQKALQENAANISARDQQRFFQNVGGANQMQMGYLGDLRNRQQNYNQMQQYLTNLGYNASGQMAQNAVNKGLANAQYDQSAFDNLSALGAFGGQNYKQNFMYNTAGGEGGGAVSAEQQIPWYLMFA